MKRFLVGAFLSCVALSAFAILPSLTNGDEPRKKVNVDVNRGGVEVDVNTDRTMERTKTTTVRTTDTKIVRGKDLMGLDIYGEKDEKLGDIEDLVIDPKSGTIRYAVLSFGGFLGMGDKFFAVPWTDIQFVSKGMTTSGTRKEDHGVLAITKEELKSAPGFDKNNWPNFADRNWNINIDKYYNEHRQTRKQGGTVR